MHLKNSIESYIETQRYHFDTYSLDEEFDFEGLSQYLRDNHAQKICERLFGETEQIRGDAHRHIVAQALAYAHATTPSQKSKVQKYVNDVLCMLRAFNEKKLPNELRYLRTSITENLLGGTEKQLADQTTEILSGVEGLLQSHQDNTPLSIDKSILLIQEGNIERVNKALAQYIQGIGIAHDLAPHYGFALKSIGDKQQLVSTPLTKEANSLFPPSYRIGGRVFIGENPAPGLTPKLFEYAHNHQLPITITVDEAKKYLGEKVDIIQAEAQMLVGQVYTFPPKPFPPAQIYSILIDDVLICDHVSLRIREKNEDGTTVYANDENPEPFLISFSVNTKKEETNFAFSYDGENHHDHLLYFEFLQKLHTGQYLTIQNTETNSVLLKTKNSSSADKEYHDRLSRQIGFLKNLITVEEHFSISIGLPNQLAIDEINRVMYLGQLILGQVQRKWEKFEIPLLIDAKTKERVQASIGKPSNYSNISKENIELFGYELSYLCVRTMQCAKLEEPEKILRKLEVLEQGDTIRLSYVPEGADGNILHERIFQDNDGKYNAFLQSMLSQQSE